MPDAPRSIDDLLAKWEIGEREALRVLFPLIYEDLRRVAHRHLRNEHPDHTLQTTALVHETYLCLEKHQAAHFQNRAHLRAVCALLMHKILTGYARPRRAAKRGGGGGNVTLEYAHGLMRGRSVDLIALDDAPNGLSRLDPAQSRVVELRFFGGLSIADTAGEMGISPATVKRLWSTARLWLYREMSGEDRT